MQNESRLVLIGILGKAGPDGDMTGIGMETIHLVRKQ